MHSAICDPLETAIGGARYMLLFIVIATRHTDEYILKCKSEAVNIFIEWKPVTWKESDKQVKQFRTDGGGEYTSKKFTECWQSEGITQDMTTPYSPESNAIIEQANRTILECVSCLLDDAGPLKKYWKFAVCVAVNLKHSTTTQSVVGKTPQNTWHGRKTILHHLSAYRCKSVDHVPTEKTKKLD